MILNSLHFVPGDSFGNKFGAFRLQANHCADFHKYSCSYYTVYPKKYAHDIVVRCFVVVMQSLIMNSHEVFIHIHRGCFAGTGAIVRLPQCQWSKPGGYWKISQCITTTKHSKAKTLCIFLGIHCTTMTTIVEWMVQITAVKSTISLLMIASIYKHLAECYENNIHPETICIIFCGW